MNKCHTPNVNLTAINKYLNKFRVAMETHKVQTNYFSQLKQSHLLCLFLDTKTMLQSSNRLKSTEKLIESDASTEEVLVPPLDLSKCRQSIGSTFSESSPVTTGKKQHVVVVDRADIHQTKEHSATPPVPAARKSLTNAEQKSSDTSIVRLENEKWVHQTAVKPKKRTVKSQAMDLIAMTPEIKPRIKKKLFGNNGESALDETTSFITYDEKHETEDANEKGEHQSDSDGTHGTDLSNRTVEKDANESLMGKKSSDEEIGSSAGENPNHDEAAEHKDETISIILHETSPLRFDASIRSPRVRIAIFDSANGHVLRARADGNDEANDKPILSHCSRLKESK